MSDKKAIPVAMFGIPEHERNVLKNIFKLSLYRIHTYTLASAQEASQILMVDMDDPTAMADWKAFRGDDVTSESSASSQGRVHPSIPTVLVTKEQPPDRVAYCIRRPFVATRLLSILDQIATQLPTRPTEERVIGAEQPRVAEVAEPSVPTALVVDDSSTVRKQIELELKLFGIRIDAVESGELAFDLLAKNNYDMIFLDVVLPGVDGYQICKTIKKDKTRKKTPVIMLTSKSSPFDRVKGALAGCDTYLTKPVKQSSFQKVVKKYLKSS